MKGLKKNFSHFFRFLPFIFLIIIVLSFFWKFFFKGLIPIPGDFIVGVYFPWLDYKWGYPAGVPVKNPITTDVVSFTYPMQTLAMNLLKNGQLPLWNPYILAGSPLLANFQSAPFAPTSFVYFLFDNITSWSFQIILQHILAAIFTYLLLRYWKVSKWGSVLGGIVFAFSGYNLIFSQWNGHTLAASFIPLVLLFEDRLLKKGKFWDGAGLAISLALQIFSGYTQSSLYTVFAMFLLWIIRIIGEKKIVIKTLFLGLFCLIALGLSAIQIAPSYEEIVNSQREFEPHPYQWAFLPWEKSITFISSDFFGNHATHNYWGPQDYTSNTGYVGVVAFVLAVIAIFNLKKNRTILFLSILGLLSLLLSFATPLSLFMWSTNILGMKANSAHRATVIFCTAMALLSGFGYDALAKLKLKQKLISLIFPTIILGCFGIWAFLLKEKLVFGISVFDIASRNLILPIGILFCCWIIILLKPRFKFLLIILCIIELFYFGWKFTPFSPRSFVYPKTPVIDFLTNQKKPFRVTGTKVIPSNIRMAYGIEAPEGYDTFHPLKMSQFIAAINSGTTKSLPVGRYGIVDNDTSHLLDLLNTKYYMALKTDPDIKRFDPKRFKPIFDDKSVQIFESKTSLERAFMVYDWEIVNDNLTQLDRLLDPSYPISKRIILNENPNISIDNGVVKNKVEYQKYSEQESVINVETSKDGLFFVSEAYYPGWNAYIDNNKTKIYLSDFAFRSIVVPQGKHTVRFAYEPESFFLGLKITIAAFSLLMLVGIAIYFM
ncbi:YfhO family protein [Candidatus Microgenomates bacterium]|nr:YfhO family protein [Candidatus Microgenomates bacterium]